MDNIYVFDDFKNKRNKEKKSNLKESETTEIKKYSALEELEHYENELILYAIVKALEKSMKKSNSWSSKTENSRFC